MRRAAVVVTRMVTDGFARTFVEFPVSHESLARRIDLVNVSGNLLLCAYGIPDAHLADLTVEFASGRIRVTDMEK